MGLVRERYGSLNNLLAASSRAKPEPPKVGDGATLISWTDRHPATVVWVSESGKTIRLQEDFARRTDKEGMSECQSYLYEPNPQAAVLTARLTKRGWKVVKGPRVVVGVREKYYDFSF
jgi:hypothetical protein